MLKSTLHLDGKIALFAFQDYPSDSIGAMLNGLSIDKKCFTFPSDKNPQQDWLWRIDVEFASAAIRLLKHFNVEVAEYEKC